MHPRAPCLARFKDLSQQQLDAWLNRRLDALDLPVVMIDGIHFADRVVLIALGVDEHAGKHILGFARAPAKPPRVVSALLSDLIERGLDAQRPRLWVIDGGKALRRAITQTFGAATSSIISPRPCTPAPIARCAMPTRPAMPTWLGVNCSA